MSSSTEARTSRSERVAVLGYDYASREFEQVRECNLCGATQHVEVTRRDRYGFPAVLLICARCGLGFLAPRLTPSEYAEFYRRVYRPLVSAYHGRVIDRDTVQVEQQQYADDLVGFLGRALDRRPSSVLDIGGSTGVVAAAVCAAFGSSATVIDPSPDELEVAAAAGMETIPAFFEDWDPGGRRFDLVLLCQTIDHLLDVAGSLTAIRRVLDEGQRAFVDVVDLTFVARRSRGIEGAVKIDHPFYLTRSTALAYFAKAGLHLVAERMSDDGHWGFLLAPGDIREPDWDALRAATDALLEEIWTMRAEAT
jgi:SAM-dependent methyltransferase